MAQLELFPLSSYPVHSNVQTFADVIELVLQDVTLIASQKRDFVHALNRVAEGLAIPCDQIKTSPAWLGPRLAQLSSKTMGIHKKTLANILSNLRKVLSIFALGRKKSKAKDELNKFWHPLWHLVLVSKSKTLRCALSGPIAYFDRCGYLPSDIKLQHFSAWKNEVSESLTRKDPDHAYQKAVRAWNQAVASIEAWPKVRLELPKDARWITLPLDQFPASFGEDLDRYLNQLKHPNRLKTKTPQMGFADTTIAQYRALLRRFASILVRAGVEPLKILNLAVLVDPAIAEVGLQWMLSRADNALTDQISDMAGLLNSVGKNYVNLSVGDQLKLEVFNKNLAMPQWRGLTEKNALRVLPFRNKDVLLKLHRLPNILFDRSMQKPKSIRSATLREDAIVIGLLLRVPIRRKNLLSIHLTENIKADGDDLRIVFSGAETKNRMPIDVKMPEQIVNMMQIHLGIRSPTLCPEECQWLFPSRRKSGPPSLSYIADRIKRRIFNEIGLEVNIHLFRHIAAITFLEANPGKMEVVRQFLGHKSLSQTIDFYAGYDSSGAVQLLSEVIESLELRQ